MADQLEELRVAGESSRQEIASLRQDLVVEVALSERMLALERAHVLTIFDGIAHAMAKQAVSPTAFAGALLSFVTSRFGVHSRADWSANHLACLAKDLQGEYGNAAGE